MRSTVRSALTKLGTGLAVMAASFLIVTIALHYWSPRAAENPNLIHIATATYGENCRAFVPAAGQANLVKTGNATVAASQTCNNTDVICPIYVDVVRIGDPAIGCAKDFTVSWRCGGEHAVHTAYAAAEAFKTIVWISCPAQE
jgi:hypothetical protein